MASNFIWKNYNSMIDTLRDLDFLDEVKNNINPFNKEFCIKGTFVLVKVHGNRYYFLPDYSGSGWVPLNKCFDRLHPIAKEHLIWHLDLFK